MVSDPWFRALPAKGGSDGKQLAWSEVHWDKPCSWLTYSCGNFWLVGVDSQLTAGPSPSSTLCLRTQSIGVSEVNTRICDFWTSWLSKCQLLSVKEIEGRGETVCLCYIQRLTNNKNNLRVSLPVCFTQNRTNSYFIYFESKTCGKPKVKLKVV